MSDDESADHSPDAPAAAEELAPGTATVAAVEGSADAAPVAPSPPSHPAAAIEEPSDDAASDLAANDSVSVAPLDDVTRTHLRGLLEALIFASDKPIKTPELAKSAAATLPQVRGLLIELKAEYEHRGVVLDEVAGGWIFRTGVAYAPFVRDITQRKPVRLSRAQVETLAILAYRQPVTRPEIDDIRGVDSGATLKLLLDRDLIRIMGKKEEAGRPLLYGTTTAFLEFFGLKSLKELPTLREFTELTDDSKRVYEDEMGNEPLPEATPDAPAIADASASPSEATTEPDAAPVVEPTPEPSPEPDAEVMDLIDLAETSGEPDASE